LKYFKEWLTAVLLLTLSAHCQIDDATRKLAREIFQQLIEINTTDSVGNVTAAAEAAAQRFRRAGFPDSDVQLLGPDERKKNLVVRLHGNGKHKPILLIGHLDVVEARREDWTTDPFQFVEKDGYFYGRGTEDMKDGDAIMITSLLRFKNEGYVPSRDIVLALTADEEAGKANGVDWLLKNHRELIDAEFVVNSDGAGVTTEQGKPIFFEVDAAEKLYADYQLRVTNPGGHSSWPGSDNAIYHLVDGLARLERYRFPLELNNVTRAYYERMAGLEAGQRAEDMRAVLKEPPDLAAAERLSQDPIDNANLRTTCVATRLNAGHANNALPQSAQAVVNCRVLPGHSIEATRQTLINLLADPSITVLYLRDDGQVLERGTDRKAYPVPPLLPQVFRPLAKTVAEMWPGTPIIPTMSAGASDDGYTSAAGLASYVISGEAIERDGHREHGKDERIGVESFFRALEFEYRFLKAITEE
jgi:acetylornithine deacetylase/succinyl-diaminopimelate desuccinylase-like protein